MSKVELLPRIQTPADMLALSDSQLLRLADEIRDELVKKFYGAKESAQLMTRAGLAPDAGVIAAEAAQGRRLILAAFAGDALVGTVQVILAQPDNQPHRADVAKLLVHRRARGTGLGAALMRAAEDGARAAGKTLLVLDTASDEAERIYRRLGWQLVGRVPDFALLPHGGYCDTRFYFQRL